MIKPSDEILGALQRGFDTVKGGGRSLSRDDDLTVDLALDSLDAIDLMSVLEEEFTADVIDNVVDSMPEIRTIGDIVDALAAAVGRTGSTP